MLTTRERVRDDRELRELEALWQAPSALEPLRVRPSLLDRLPPVRGDWLLYGWVAFFFIAIAFQPAPAHDVASPLWADLVFAGMMIGLLGAIPLGTFSGTAGFTAATAGGAFGIAVAVACSSTGHHLGNWWLFELGATAALTGAAATGLADRLRR
jgi:hypothetical protein